jgi:alkylated DNA nucleotide flippase Atl1
VELPHHEGRAGCVAIVFNPSALAGESGTPSSEALKSLAQHVRAGLPKYALPLFLRVVKPGAIQTTGTNKQQKTTLRNEGVEPGKTGADDVFWLKGDSYVKFEPGDWKALEVGKVKL